jgi:hypothetical protein
MAEKVKCLENLTCETLGIALIAFNSNIKIDFLDIGLCLVGDLKS